MNNGLSLDLSSLIGGSTLQAAATAATALPEVTQNRARLAALTELGYEGLDFYEEWKPALFLVSLLGLALSGTALAKRRKVPEAVALYSAMAIGSAGMAWITRPDFLKGAPAVPDPSLPQPAAPSGAAVPGALSWLDSRVSNLTRVDPGWESRTLLRLANDLGTGTMDPAIQTLLTSNTH